MRKMFTVMAVISIGLAGVARTRAQFSEDPSAASADQPAGLRTVISDKPFFGTRNVLTLSGDYVNSPNEDFEMYGKWSQPFTLEEMNGVIAKVDFGEARKQGEWQLSYRYRLMVTDNAWQRLADYSGGLTLSDRRSQVLKASYNVRDWWKLGVAALVEDRLGTDAGTDSPTFGLNGRGSYGFQLDSTFKF
jgi:hypothetical protein